MIRRMRVWLNRRTRRNTYLAVFGTPEGRKVLACLRHFAGMGSPLPLEPLLMNRVAGRQEVVQEIQQVLGLTDAECLEHDRIGESGAEEEFREVA